MNSEVLRNSQGPERRSRPRSAMLKVGASVTVGLAVALVAMTCNSDTATAPSAGSYPSTPVGMGVIDGTGLDLNQVLVAGGIPARRSVIATGFFRPSVVMTAKGDLLAALFSSRSDIENVNVSRSTDGFQWSSPREVLPGRDPYLFRLQNGTILLSHGTLDTDPRFPGKAFMSVSHDDGQTWEMKEIMRSLIPGADQLGGAHGLIELPSGEVLAFFVALFGNEVRVYTLHSMDSGSSWANPQLVFRYADEVSVVRLGSGRLLAAVRLDAASPGLTGDSRDYQPFVNTAHPRDQVGMSQSDDNGRTWSVVRPILPPSAAPPHLLRLRDGRIVMTYGVRFWPRGVQAIISYDDGTTWDFTHRYFLAWHSLDYNTGYPWSVQLADGSILTSYYARRTETANFTGDVASEVIRWNP